MEPDGTTDKFRSYTTRYHLPAQLDANTRCSGKGAGDGTLGRSSSTMLKSILRTKLPRPRRTTN